MKTNDIVNIALFATLLSVCAWICIPMTVPFTMQTFAVFLAMLVLGGRKGTVVILIYLLLGSIGIPVFSGGTGGIGVLFGVTGGYMIGWIFLGLIVCAGDRIASKYSVVKGEVHANGRSLSTGKQFVVVKKYIQFIALFIGLIICYFIGTLWFTAVYSQNAGEMGFFTVFGISVVPFIVPDIIKLFLAFIVSKRIKKIVGNV